MSAPRLLDAFSGAGGASRGYQMAGFHVTGIDINPQPRYAGDAFIQGDALEYIAKHGHEYDCIHASPPCQAYSEATPVAVRATLPALIDETRRRIAQTGKPYVIENVENARRHLVNPVMLCGTMFGLSVWRHRYFEIAPIWFLSPAPCRHSGRPVSLHPGSNARKGRGDVSVSEARAAMQIDWMSKAEIHEAIPPIYTKHIGEQLMRAIEPAPPPDLPSVVPPGGETREYRIAAQRIKPGKEAVALDEVRRHFPTAVLWVSPAFLAAADAETGYLLRVERRCTATEILMGKDAA